MYLNQYLESTLRLLDLDHFEIVGIVVYAMIDGAQAIFPSGNRT